MSARVSVVSTVYNEGDSMERLLTSLETQTLRPDEVVIVDGGSSDGTVAILERCARSTTLHLKVVVKPGCNISEGRNAAIAESRGDVIAITDAGVRLEPDWLQRLVAPFLGENPPDVVSGFFASDPRSTFEMALGAITLPLLEEIDGAIFQPSSRSVALRRKAWESVGGYPEWLDYCEDLVFDFALRDAGYRFVFEPRALVHFRPRKSLTAFFRQYYRYARGDGKADLFLIRHLIRYGTYLVAVPVLCVLGLAQHPAWFAALAAGFLFMMWRPLRRLRPWLGGVSLREQILLLAWVPVIRVTGDLAKMLGYPVGVIWRYRHRPASPRSRRAL